MKKIQKVVPVTKTLKKNLLADTSSPTVNEPWIGRHKNGRVVLFYWVDDVKITIQLGILDGSVLEEGDIKMVVVNPLAYKKFNGNIKVRVR